MLEKHWLKIIENENFLNYSQKKLENSIKKGIPFKFKIKIWLIISNVPEKIKKYPNYYKSLLKMDSSWKKLIDKDLKRTRFSSKLNVEVKFYKEENQNNSLKRILLAFSNHNPEIGYMQGSK